MALRVPFQTLALATALFGVAAAAKAGPVAIDVTNVRHAWGHIVAALCPKQAFLHLACPYESKAPAQAGTTTVVFPASISLRMQ